MSEEMKYDLSGVHAVNLKLLKEIDRICRKYKIKYALTRGRSWGPSAMAALSPGTTMWTWSLPGLIMKCSKRWRGGSCRRACPFVEPDEYHGGKAFMILFPGDL